MLMSDYIITPDSKVEEIGQEDPVLGYENKNYSVPVRDTGIDYHIIKDVFVKEEDISAKYTVCEVVYDENGTL